MLALLLLLQVPTPPRLTQFLQQSIGFDAAQLATIERGEPVVKVLDTRGRGDSAMAIYDDRGNLTVRSSEAFAAQLAESPFVYQTVPSLQSYFASYPRASLPAGAAEIVFWSEDVLPRLRPILSVTHLVV